ncbi:hypothetical protein GGI04_002558 [Coemansia thaxteri]|uniref:Survival Motor Neuron Gemin2-binding domain-containing protein n=1 Tax=Coemansia thaxteri TaxID=2663907 RepID=A0A9W8BH15_9FUNG|nr:hypothetical protein GGI04_002558 [Coemansia thaxteri]KAJ2005023.1 hypothetical protein H4R26_002175 [Coemansia thaxteri]KAJ2469338.1 hypothetical protein GGI02_003419 [Coemansia sp. RSA 2322]KAJ2485380.1 hypothetical protein EV174_001762 [Coemansia sp. RSA 2320]
MAARQKVSYDDLYSADEAEAGVEAEAEQRPASAQSSNASGGDDGSEDDAYAGGIAAQAGTWDDSELVRAWDSTIEDYRRQHASILGDSELRATLHKTESKVGQWAAVEEELAGAAAMTNSSKKRRHGADDVIMRDPTESGGEAGAMAQEYASTLPGFPEPPQSEEDALSKLNMAWYHTGFYAGYYQVREQLKTA